MRRSLIFTGVGQNVNDVLKSMASEDAEDASELWLCNNQLRSFPMHVISNSLTKLFLRDNHLESLPSGLQSLKALTVLDLRCNRIHALSAELVFPHLEILVLAENCLQWIPEKLLLEATNLHTLDLRGNQLAPGLNRLACANSNQYDVYHACCQCIAGAGFFCRTPGSSQFVSAAKEFTEDFKDVALSVRCIDNNAQIPKAEMIKVIKVGRSANACSVGTGNYMLEMSKMKTNVKSLKIELDKLVSFDKDNTAVRELVAELKASGGLDRSVVVAPHETPPQWMQVYEPVRVLGSGGFGEVWLAKARFSGQLVAVKVLGSTGAAALADLRNEVTVLQGLKHENVVKYFGFFDAPGAALVMEYMNVGDLLDFSRQNVEKMDELWQPLLRSASKGLSYFHKKGLVHRDIKCQNFFIKDDHSVVLGDVGLTVMSQSLLTLDRKKKNKSFMVSKAKGSTVAKGTASHLPPEGFLQGIYDANGKGDVWAFGVVCIELMRGRPPFADIIYEARGAHDVERKIKEHVVSMGAAPNGGAFNGDLFNTEGLPDRLVKLAHMCCVYDRHDRPSMKQVRRFLSPVTPQEFAELYGTMSPKDRQEAKKLIENYRETPKKMKQVRLLAIDPMDLL